jgi:hypothetical protein
MEALTTLPEKDQPAPIGRNSSGRNKKSRTARTAKPGFLLVETDALSQRRNGIAYTLTTTTPLGSR